MTVLADRFGRTFPYLRLSIIEACNFRCSYCLPNGFLARPGRPEPLSREEITRLLQGFAAVGLRNPDLGGLATSVLAVGRLRQVSGSVGDEGDRAAVG